ncbi:MAG: penicillin acylase family protein [Candidatus Aminicenantes bacterium]|nr:penicillin acylase family protein [Candidatus Aminicenantes bacterium]
MDSQKKRRNLRKKIGLVAMIFSVIILIAFVAFFLYFRHLQIKALPIYHGLINLQGLREPVEILRDQYGVPHILARHETDLYLATGYIMAQDRLWQMDLIRRITSGRLSEIFGESFVATDLFLRALRIPEKARRVLAATPADALQAVEAFAQGINAFIQANRNHLPVEFRLLRYQPEPWTPEHSASLIGYIGWDLAFAWEIESILWQLQEKLSNQEEKLVELLAEPMNPTYVYPNFSLAKEIKNEIESNVLPIIDRRAENKEKKFFILYPFEFNQFKFNYLGINHLNNPLSSKFSKKAKPIDSTFLIEAAEKLKELGITLIMNSNNWAIDSKKSSTGKPILANDMHLGLNLPSIWYPLHQSVEGKFRVSGVALPGEPFVVAGHNDFIAWGMTNVMADDMDFYLEKVDPQNPNQYLFEGKWRPIEVKAEKIKIKGGKEINRHLRFTHRGPIISEFKEIKDRLISMRWTGFEESNELLAVYLLNRARNWSEFRQALRFFRSLSQNVIYADIENNIGLQLAGGIPKRSWPSWNLLPGELASSDWPELIPFEELPFVFNPPEGLVVSANNKSVDESYPYFLSYFFLSPVRAERIKEFLASKEKLSPQDMATLQNDVQSKLASQLKPHLINILSNLSELSDIEAKALELLKRWDGSMAISSPAATIFDFLYFELGHQMVIDELGQSLGHRFISAGSNVFLHGFLERALTSKKSAWADDITTLDKTESVEDIVERSFRTTINSLIKIAGNDLNQWIWGNFHRLIFTHPLGQVGLLNFLFKLNRGPYPVGGSFHTVNAFGYSSGSFQVKHGPSQRHIFSLHNFDESLTILPGGVSGLPFSAHYDDQISLYVKGEYRPAFFSKEKIKQASRYRLLLVPKKN